MVETKHLLMRPDFFQVSAFGKTKEFVDTYLKKGMKVQVSGTVQNDNYEKDGVTVNHDSYIANEIEFCEKKGSGGAEESVDVGEDSEGEIPFM